MPESAMASIPKIQTPKANTTPSTTKHPTNQHQNTQNTASPTSTRPTPPSGFWADKIRVTDSNTRCTLDPIPRKPVGSRLKMTRGLWEKSSTVWHRCLVGFFPGFKLPYSAMNSIAHRIWKRFGLEDVTSLANGFTMFRFKTEDELQKVIENGPWMFGGKAIILQKWHSGFVFDMNKITKLPVWIRIYDLPFPLWTKEGLSEVASMVGQPLSCDELTLGCKRLDYARLCVEVDASLPFVHKFELEFSNTIREVHVNYEWKPKRCEKCHVFGHSCQPSADKQGNNDVSPSHQVKGNASHASNTDDKQLNGDASTSHQGKGKAITSLATNTYEMSSEESDSSGETDTDYSDETDTDESASDSLDESQLKPSDLGDVNPITPPLSTNNHVQTTPLELPMCTTSKQMALPSSFETSSSS